MTGKLKFLSSKIRKWIKDNRCNRKVAFDKLKEYLRLVDEAIDKGEQHDELEHEVTIEEIKTAMWNCGTDKSSGLNGFTFDFYRQFWSTIDKDVLINILGDIVSEVQSAFVAGRQILDGPFILNEVLHWCSKKKHKSFIFKVDFEKAYDSVRSDFLDDVLKNFGFGNKWCNWIQCCLKSSRGSILVNGSPTDEFQFFKGLKQGDPLKINMCKSKIMGVNVEGSYVNQAAVKLGCQVLTSPFIYLGTKVGGTMFRVQAWQEVVEKVLWVKWNNVLTDKKRGGLSVLSLYALNKELMIKWLWKFFVHKDSIWTKVITAIHGVNGNVNSSGEKAGRSCWFAIMDEVRALHKKGGYVFDFMNLKLGNREMVKFWLDRWYEGGILKDLFPRMFALENMKEVRGSQGAAVGIASKVFESFDCNKVLREVTAETIATGVWSKLENLYMTKSLANKLYLKKKLYTFYMSDGRKISKHMDEFNQIVFDLTDIEWFDDHSSGLIYDGFEMMMVISTEALLGWIMDSRGSYHMIP
nr:RNA-directed DNA polymerase, eukaryota, reverse transcriptase zinc-binding domain protein [Tanacetum cinerariifolium]